MRKFRQRPTSGGSRIFEKAEREAEECHHCRHLSQMRVTNYTLFFAGGGDLLRKKLQIPLGWGDPPPRASLPLNPPLPATVIFLPPKTEFLARPLTAVHLCFLFSEVFIVGFFRVDFPENLLFHCSRFFSVVTPSQVICGVCFAENLTADAVSVKHRLRHTDKRTDTRNRICCILPKMWRLVAIILMGFLIITD